MFSFSSLDNRTEENHTETIMSNYSACSLRFAESVEVSQRYIVWHFSRVCCVSSALVQDMFSHRV